MKIIALDPGTWITGYAIFRDTSETGRIHAMSLHSFGSIKAPNGTEVEDRIKWIMESVDQLLPVDTVVCEAQPTMKGRVSPELAVLIRRFRRWATKLNVPWEPINTSTVTAEMRRALPKLLKGEKRLPAETRALGVQKIYGLPPGSLGQDILDAVAVGRTYLVHGHLK